MALGVAMVLLAIAGAVGSVMMFNAAMERANRVKCAAGLRQIRQGIASYANDNAGAYPPSLASLVTEYNFPVTVFVCASSSDTAATGPTTQAVVANLVQPGHMSYVYLGAGMNWHVKPDMIIAYERLENHDGKGMHVLLGNDCVEWFSRPGAEHILRELKAGRNPPR